MEAGTGITEGIALALPDYLWEQLAKAVKKKGVSKSCQFCKWIKWAREFRKWKQKINQALTRKHKTHC